VNIAPSRMPAVDVLRLALLGFRSRRLRVALACLGIAIGVSAVVAVLGISASSEADLLAQIASLGNRLTVQPGQTLAGGQAELPRDAPAMIRRIGPVTGVSATGGVNANVFRTDRIPTTDTLGLSVMTTDADLLPVMGGSLSQGAYLNPATMRFPATVLGSVAARRLGIYQPGVRVWIGGHWFTVVGILNPVPLAPEIDRAALIGGPVAGQLFGSDGSPSTVYVRADPEWVTQVRTVLPPTADPAHPEQVAVSRPSDALAARAAAQGAYTALFLGLGAVALLVGGVGIANVMFVAVLERRPEIGLRRALGARRLHIGIQFLAEAVLLSALGGVAGVVAGVAITAGSDAVQGLPLVVPAAGIAGGVAVAALAGAVAGLYPALRAAGLSPTDALRTA
jgi:ABC-type antimicrobial peptide transport system permease subunit